MTDEISPEVIEAAIQTLIESHRLNEGATVNLNAENLTGRKLFAIGVFTELSRRIKARELPEHIVRRFVKSNIDLLKHPICAVGSWFQADEERSYLDICVVVSDAELAKELGDEYNQQAIYDLAEGETIWLDGDGTTPPSKRNLTNSEILNSVVERIQEQENG